MKKTKTYVFLKTLIIISLVFTLANGGPIWAKERVGSLVFQAIDTMRENQKDFLTGIKGVKTERKAAEVKKKELKKEYLKTQPGTVRAEELGAEYSKQLALVLKNLKQELDLTRTVAQKQALTLYDILKKVEKGESTLEGKQVNNVVRSSVPVLNSARSLLQSLARFKENFTDKSIVDKLNQATKTAELLAKYVAAAQHKEANSYSSHKVLSQKLRKLLENFNGIYAQSDILMSMLHNKVERLKLINQIAVSELGIRAITSGEEMAGDLNHNFLGPIENTLNVTDDDIDILGSRAGAFVTGTENGASSDFPRWTKPAF